MGREKDVCAFSWPTRRNAELSELNMMSNYEKDALLLTFMTMPIKIKQSAASSTYEGGGLYGTFLFCETRSDRMECGE